MAIAYVWGKCLAGSSEVYVCGKGLCWVTVGCVLFEVSLWGLYGRVCVGVVCERYREGCVKACVGAKEVWVVWGGVWGYFRKVG